MGNNWRALNKSLNDKKDYLDKDVFEEMTDIIKDQSEKETEKNLTKIGDNVEKLISKGIPLESIQNTVLANYNKRAGLI